MTGYPPEDLLLRPGFLRAAEGSLEQIALSARGIVVLVGAPHFDRDLYNACAVCAGGEVKAMVKKRFLPNYGVFDEMRYFASGNELYLFEHGETLIGVTVCEDMWQPGPPATDLALAGAELIVNISASPFHLLRDREREEMFRTRARDNSAYRRVLQHRRRAGRADLRRPLARDRRRGKRPRARARLRGGAADRRRRPVVGASPAG